MGYEFEWCYCLESLTINIIFLIKSNGIFHDQINNHGFFLGQTIKLKEQ